MDGTLLNQEALISPKSKLLLNAAIENGAAFTIATARSIAMTQPLIGGLDLHWPIILMNGVFLYDPISRRYIRALTLASSTVRCLGELFERNQIPYFLYTLQDETLVLYHHPMKSWQEQHFWERRQENRRNGSSKRMSYRIWTTPCKPYTLPSLGKRR